MVLKGGKVWLKRGKEEVWVKKRGRVRCKDTKGIFLRWETAEGTRDEV
jgi:hypothetical protein